MEIVMEGDSVTLQTEFMNNEGNDHKSWGFEPKNTDKMESIFTIDGVSERFRGRVKLNPNGSLTITNIRLSDSGYYIMSSDGSSQKMFRVFVSELKQVSTPAITTAGAQTEVSQTQSVRASRCLVLCSVLNVSALSLSWYKGNSVLSSISVSDLSISLSLPLEVEHQDNNTYSCVVNNTITNHTTDLDISQTCQPCEDTGHCCGFTEAVIRLALSALVGVATIAVLVDHFRTMKAEQKMREDTSLSVP
ncbi:roundabout homolog 2-like [Danio aesculapii]|uniref:roundabout homolog 2-like n=1 Tax=Danio aesculapii TaxID=1142201 RepID=UPI0024BF5025|nr:roundabout homolog 2-like [Danio aesculapii]